MQMAFDQAAFLRRRQVVEIAVKQIIVKTRLCRRRCDVVTLPLHTQMLSNFYGACSILQIIVTCAVNSLSRDF
jgi:hypothetical protein